MLSDLKNLYQSLGISAENFNCPHFKECSRLNSSYFSTAKEAFVSSGYENHSLPRILFLSLDSGGGSRYPADKTLDSVRKQEEVDCQVLALPRNKHWFRTHELAYTLLRNFSPGLKLEEAKHYFAHTNSAKCCQNNPQRAQVNSVLFENCRAFIGGEISILDPDILITQGDFARKAVNFAFTPIDFDLGIKDQVVVPDEVKVLPIQNRAIIWIHTFHPRNPNSKVNRDQYPIYEKIVYEFISKTDSPIPLATLPQDKVFQKSSSPRKETPGTMDMNRYGDYIFLDSPPPTPPSTTRTKRGLTRSECAGYEYMTMVQLCDIAEAHGRSRSSACNAFGGDKGKYPVESDRKARAALVGSQLRKYVLIRAVIDYFHEVGIRW